MKTIDNAIKNVAKYVAMTNSMDGLETLMMLNRIKASQEIESVTA